MQLHVRMQVLETFFLGEKEWSLREEQSRPLCCASGKDNTASGGFAGICSTPKGYIHLCSTLQEASSKLTSLEIGISTVLKNDLFL